MYLHLQIFQKPTFVNNTKIRNYEKFLKAYECILRVTV